MSAEHLLALDAGTSSARCLIARPGAGTVASAREEWCYDTPPEIAPLGKSFDADTFWSVLCGVTKQALDGAGISRSDVAAVGVTSQRLAVVIIDSDGKALYAGPNIDVRALQEGLVIETRLAGRVYASSGKLPSLLLAPARIQWLRNKHAADFSCAAAVLAMGDWMAYRLTGEARGERSLAADCGLLNVATGERDTDLLDELDVPAKLLPPLVSSGDVVGEVTHDAAKATGLAPGTPVVIAGSDTQVALLGMGVTEPGDVGIAAGWSCPLQLVTAEPRLDAARRTWLCLHVVPNRWAVESSATDAGRMWRWWCETLLGESADSLDDAAALVDQAAPAAMGLLALFGPGRMNAGAMGVHLGGLLMTTPLVTDSVGRPELLRAALENIAFALRANLSQAEEVSGLRARRIAVGGGLTRVPVFASILASVFGRPVEAAREVEVTGRGAAILAARAVGLSDAGLGAPMATIEPDAAVVETYARQYERWRTLADELDAVRGHLP